MKALGIVTTVALAAALAPAASAANGALAYSEEPAASGPHDSGGIAYGDPVAGDPVATEPKSQAKPKRRRRRRPSSIRARPRLESFAVTPSVLTPGQAPVVSFRIKGRAPTITLRIVASWPGTDLPERRVDLGRLPANLDQTLALEALADPALPEGQMSLRIAGRDSAGRILRPGAHLSRVATLEVRGHVFPLRGIFSYGGNGARFGAGRAGHTHQGQDLLADEGTPVVAPRAGTITYVEYQARGAGYYVVLDGDGEELDYAFMHLQKDSIPVEEGEHVDQGQRLGSVGDTGAAEGFHLHFEIWQGTWWGDGKPVDPLPYLQQWETWSPVRAAI